MSRTVGDWLDPGFVRAWAADDVLADLLDFPRRLAAALAGSDGEAPRLIIDVGAGPGGFLVAMLSAYPDARAVWLDLSSEMEAMARRALEPFGPRVSYVLGDMTRLTELELPKGADVLVTSRASHHLDAAELARFYAEAASLLRPGGWLLNLDHVRPPEGWEVRYRATRRLLVGERRERADHHHGRPLPHLEVHLRALEAAGVEGVDIAWKAFFTVLLAGRAPA